MRVLTVLPQDNLQQVGAAAAALWLLSTFGLRFVRGTTILQTGDAS